MADKPLNLIFLTCDELRGAAVGFLGNKDCKTPCLDAFAEDATVFPNHFTVHGKCVPSRIAMVTGRYTHTDGFRTINQHLTEDQPNMMRFLRANGYETSIFGINHMYETLFDNHNAHEGYADYHSFIDGPLHDMAQLDRAVPKPGPDARQPSPELEGYPFRAPYRIEDKIGGFSDDNRTEQVLYYLRELRDKDKPMYLHVNLSKPHPGYEAPEPFYSMYNPADIEAWPHELPKNAPLNLRKMLEIRAGGNPHEMALREFQAVYYAMITKVEGMIGQIIDELKAQGEYENSIIIFTADHGDFAGQYGLHEKWDTYMGDCIMHVPFILRAPGLEKGTRVESMSEHTDIVPTVMDLLGLQTDWGVHGESMVPLAKGEKKKQAVFGNGGHEEEMWGRFNFAKKDKDGKPRNKDGKQLTYIQCPETMSRTKMIRTDDWKLVIRLTGGNELYNLKDDPWELNNIYDQHETDLEIKAVVADLQLQLVEWCLRTDTDRPFQEKVGA